MEELDCGEDGPRTGDQLSDPADIIAERAVLVTGLNAMPAGTREAAAMVLDGMSFAEAATALGTTDRGIEGRLYRARAARAQGRESQKEA